MVKHPPTLRLYKGTSLNLRQKVCSAFVKQLFIDSFSYFPLEDIGWLWSLLDAGTLTPTIFSDTPPPGADVHFRNVYSDDTIHETEQPMLAQSVTVDSINRPYNYSSTLSNHRHHRQRPASASAVEHPEGLSEPSTRYCQCNGTLERGFQSLSLESKHLDRFSHRCLGQCGQNGWLVTCSSYSVIVL